jgi:hypothetical protein
MLAGSQDQLLVDAHLSQDPNGVYGLQSCRVRPWRAGCERFLVIICRLPDGCISNESCARVSRGALDVEDSIFEVHMTPEQQWFPDF